METTPTWPPIIWSSTEPLTAVVTLTQDVSHLWVDPTASGRSLQPILALSRPSTWTRCRTRQTGALRRSTKTCIPGKPRIWKDKPQLEILRDTEEMPPFIFLLHCWTFWKGLSVLLQGLWSYLGVRIVVFFLWNGFFCGCWLSYEVLTGSWKSHHIKWKVLGFDLWLRFRFISFLSPALTSLLSLEPVTPALLFIVCFGATDTTILALYGFGGSLSFSCTKRLGVDEKTCHVQILGTLGLLLGWTWTGWTGTAMAQELT